MGTDMVMRLHLKQKALNMSRRSTSTLAHSCSREAGSDKTVLKSGHASGDASVATHTRQTCPMDEKQRLCGGCNVRVSRDGVCSVRMYVAGVVVFQ